MKISTFYDHALDVAKQENISVLEAMHELKNLGISGVEVSANNIDERETELKKELLETGIKVSSVCAYFDFGRSRDEQILDDMLDKTERMNCEKMLVIPGFFEKNDSDADKENQVAQTVEMMNILAEKAKRRKIMLLLEDYDSDIAFFYNIAGMKHLLDNVSGLKASFDTGNFKFAGEDEIEAYNMFKNNIGYVHLKDRAISPYDKADEGIADFSGKMMYSCPVGSGVIKIKEIVEQLKKNGYNDAYSIEHYGSPNQLHYLNESVKYLREIL